MLAGAWVVALLLAGAPFLAMMGGSGDDADAEEAEVAEPPETPVDTADPEETGALKDMAVGPPTDYEYILHRPGEHVIEGFRPGVDTLTLTSDKWDFDLFDLGPDEEGARLRIDHGGDFSILRFPGLTALPLDDMLLKVTVPEDTPTVTALRAALVPDDLVLAPADPDAPDDLPDDPSPDSGLSPTDGDEDEDDPPDPAEGEPLLPTDPDAPEDPP